MELCGHATLASAHVVFQHLGFAKDTIIFRSLHSSDLNVSKTGSDQLSLDFPADMPTQVPIQKIIFESLNIKPRELYRGRHDFMVVLDTQEEVEALNPDFKKMAAVQSRGVVVTAPGQQSDFVSRCFFPQSGIDEDPVTGSAHTMMIPFWAARLGKKDLSAIQLSRRRGHLDCTLAGDRVYIAGKAYTFLQGEIFI